MNNIQPKSISYEGYIVTTDQYLMQTDRIHVWLSTKSHWAINIPFETVKTFVENSFCAGVFIDGVQIGFARFITDYSVFAYLADVYIEEEHRGKGLSKQLTELMMNEEWVKNLRRLFLATKDAHTLYTRYGFGPLFYPDRMMEIFKPDHYEKETE